MSNRSMITVVALLVLCSLLLVNAQYQARRLLIENERAKFRQSELETEWDKLQYEQSTLAKHSRIDGIARTSLNMSVPGPGRTQYMNAGSR